MSCYRVFGFAVAVMLVCFAAVAQADTQLLTNPDVVSGGGGWTFWGNAGYTANDGRPDSGYVQGSPSEGACNISSHSIVAGEQFSLTWDAANVYAPSSSVDVTQTASLVYLNAEQNMVTIVANTIDLGTYSGTPAWASYDNLSFTAQVGDPWIGSVIGVRFATGTGTSVYADFDNVKLNLITPEPGTIVLLITGLVSLLCYAWRKRK